MRFLGAVIVSYLFGCLLFLAIPDDEIRGINFKPLIILVPLVVAYGEDILLTLILLGSDISIFENNLILEKLGNCTFIKHEMSCLMTQ